MSRREKIILGVMAVVVAIVGLLFLLDQKTGAPSAEKAPSVEETRAYAAQITTRLAEVKESESDAPYILRQAVEPLRQDPFINRALLEKLQDRNVQQVAPRIDIDQSKFKYSGFLESGSNRLAVIDGLEYQEGEMIEQEGGYIIKEINKNKVVIGLENSPSTVEIPLEEE
jgi:hypothetical protein